MPKRRFRHCFNGSPAGSALSLLVNEKDGACVVDEYKWLATKQRRYLYDDSNLIAEFSVNPTIEALTRRRRCWYLEGDVPVIAD